METSKEISNEAVLYQHALSEAPEPVDDDELVRRIARSFEISSREFINHGTSFWQQFEAKHEDIKAALDARDYRHFGHLLRNPSETELFWGFDDLVRGFVPSGAHDLGARTVRANVIYNALVQTAIGSGAIRCPYPEASQKSPQPPIEDLLTALDDRFGFRLDFPNPFRAEFGIYTSRGIVSYRAANALYQSWRIKQISDLVDGKRILEIGAGLGRNAYFTRRLGINNYTIVDIPRTQLAQGYYLSRILDPDLVSLCGEPDKDVRIRTPKWLIETNETFDVILNADSLTEMDREHAQVYAQFARERSSALLSINHEFNPETAQAIFHKSGIRISQRSPYWPRSGYVEEFSLFKLKALQVKIEDLRSELRALKNSRSWRITAPLRRLRSLLC